MKKRKIALLSNVTADLVAAGLRRGYDVLLPAGYDAWVQEALDSSSPLYDGTAEAVVLLLDATAGRVWRDESEAREHIADWKQAVRAIAENVRTAPVFVPTLDMRLNRIRALAERSYGLELENDWYQFIQALSEQSGNVYVYDLRDRIADVGRERFYSDKMWYMGNMPYSRDGLSAVVQMIERLLSSAFSPRKKAVVLDLDNTLWGGVVGEDGAEGIELSDHKEGERFYDFQRQLLEMKKRGTLLAIDSKNNAEDVEAVFASHPYMLLKKEDFAQSRINWEDKGGNLQSIARQLNLTEGSFLFVDDNPLERELVSGACPEVTVPAFPDDTTTLVRFAEELYETYLRPLRVLEEDAHKTEMYRSEAQREQERQNSLSVDDYIAKLEMRVDIHRMREQELERAAQLCGKTNQFNLTTKRYTAAELQAIAGDENCAVYTVHAGDKYGEHGLISLLILKRLGTEVQIDTFLMSCRVMGRKLEDVIVNELAMFCQPSAETLIGEYVPTAKNAPVRELYDRLGFSVQEQNNGAKTYALDLKTYERKQLTAFQMVTFEG